MLSLVKSDIRRTSTVSVHKIGYFGDFGKPCIITQMETV